jgi:hypothetical protein
LGDYTTAQVKSDIKGPYFGDIKKTKGVTMLERKKDQMQTMFKDYLSKYQTHNVPQVEPSTEHKIPNKDLEDEISMRTIMDNNTDQTPKMITGREFNIGVEIVDHANSQIMRMASQNSIKFLKTMTESTVKLDQNHLPKP